MARIIIALFIQNLLVPDTIYNLLIYFEKIHLMCEDLVFSDENGRYVSINTNCIHSTKDIKMSGALENLRFSRFGCRKIPVIFLNREFQIEILLCSRNKAINL